MDKRLTIVFCCNTTFGLVNFRAGVMKEFVSNGYKVVVVSPRDQYVERLAAIGVVYKEWGMSGGSTAIMGEIKALLQLVLIYKKIKPDLAIHYTIKPVVYGAIAGRLNSIPFISIITGLGYSFINSNLISRITRALYRLTLRWSREVWFLNRDDREVFERSNILPRKTIARILPGEGINTTHFVPEESPVLSEKVTFLMIARLLRDKGVIEFVEAAKTLISANANACFKILGQIDSQNPSAISFRFIKELEASGAFEYLGSRRDVRSAICEADCVVLPSYREGMPRVLLEAAAMAKPMIATDVPGCRDVVVSGETGLLCRPRDVGSLVAAMIKFIETPIASRQTMGREARLLVERKFDERIVIQLYLDIVKRLSGELG